MPNYLLNSNDQALVPVGTNVFDDTFGVGVVGPLIVRCTSCGGIAYGVVFPVDNEEGFDLHVYCASALQPGAIPIPQKNDSLSRHASYQRTWQLLLTRSFRDQTLLGRNHLCLTTNTDQNFSNEANLN